MALIYLDFRCKNSLPFWLHGRALDFKSRGREFKSRWGQTKIYLKKILPCRILIFCYFECLGCLLWSLDGHSHSALLFIQIHLAVVCVIIHTGINRNTAVIKIAFTPNTLDLRLRITILISKRVIQKRRRTNFNKSHLTLYCFLTKWCAA